MARTKEKLSKPPELAGEIFRVVRLLPAGLSLGNHSVISRRLSDEDKDGRIAQFENYTVLGGVEDDGQNDPYPEDDALLSYRPDWGFYELKALEICLEGLPAEFVDYVRMPRNDLKHIYDVAIESGLGRSERFESLKSFQALVMQDPYVTELIFYGVATDLAVDRYNLARDWYKRLYNLAEFAERYQNERRGRDFMSLTGVFSANQIRVTDGRFDFRLDQFTQAFRGLPVERVKLCERCGRVFWANRLNMRGCTSECTSVLSTRKWREKTTEDQRRTYKINRIEKELRSGGE